MIPVGERSLAESSASVEDAIGGAEPIDRWVVEITDVDTHLRRTGSVSR
jgi:hypothetical protein